MNDFIDMLWQVGFWSFIALVIFLFCIGQIEIAWIMVGAANIVVGIWCLCD